MPLTVSQQPSPEQLANFNPVKSECILQAKDNQTVPFQWEADHDSYDSGANGHYIGKKDRITAGLPI